MDAKLYWYKAKCVKVVDGDTADILLDLGVDTFRKERVRLYGVNTPETFGVKRGSEEYKRGMESKAFTKSFITGKQLYVKTIKDKSGKYGRLLVEIYVDGVCLNDELVKNGLAERKDY
jgi:micrococcal nuclease